MYKTIGVTIEHMETRDTWREWLKKRGIADSIIDQFSLKYSIHPTFSGGCIVIPVKDAEGNVVFNKYRRYPGSAKPKYIYDKGGLTTLYGWHLAKDTTTPLLITEGELDALTAWSQEIPAVSSTGGALSFQAAWAPLVTDRELYVCFDTDQAGGEGMARLLNLFPHAHLVFLPGAYKDISDYVIAGGSISALLREHSKTFTSIQEVVDDRSERLATWENTWFHDAYIEKHTAPTPTARLIPKDDTRLAKAKAYPMTNLIRFRGNQAVCPWHNDKTPSLHYYESTNTAYCFGACGKAYDAIDAYILIHSVSFKEALSALI